MPFSSFPACRVPFLKMWIGFLGLMVSVVTPVIAAPPVKPMSASDVLKRYLRVMGGDKALKAIRETSYSGSVLLADGSAGRFRIDTQFPDRRFFEIRLDTDNRVEIANGNSIWQQTTRDGATTLLDDEARARKAEVLLFADRRVDFKKMSFAVHLLPPVTINERACYALEFTSRQQARIRWFIDANTFLLTRVESGEGAGRRQFDFPEYKAVNGVPEPVRIELHEGNSPAVTLRVETVRRNTGLPAELFAIHHMSESNDIPALLAKVITNQQKIDERVTNYTYLLTETRRDLDKNGQIKETKVKVYEIYPLAGNERVRKLIRVDGKALDAEAEKKEQERVMKFIRDNERRQEQRKLGKADEDDNEKKRALKIQDFLNACDLYAPRRETLRGREVTVCDFRPKPDFKPATDAEKIANKLSGTVWIDRIDTVISRLEGRFDDSYKIGGGLVASLQKGTAFTFEQTRTAEGVWLPLRADFNAGIKVFLLAGLNVSVENRYSDYKRFTVTTSSDLEAAPQ